MTITTLDGVVAGMQWPRFFTKSASGTLVAGRLHSYWGVAGNPTAGSQTATLNGAALSGTTTGAIPFSNPVSGNTYLARYSCTMAQAGVVVLADRLWQNQLTVNSTTLQSPTTPTWPARDVNGSTNGEGVFLAIETSVAASATATTVTVTYTNSAGTTSQTAGFLDAPTAAATLAGTMFRIGLASGDTGVRAVTGVQFGTAWTTGTINMVAYRPIAMLEFSTASIPNYIDAVTGGMPRIFDDSVLYQFIVPSTTTTTGLNGQIVFTQG